MWGELETKAKRGHCEGGARVCAFGRSWRRMKVPRDNVAMLLEHVGVFRASLGAIFWGGAIVALYSLVHFIFGLFRESIWSISLAILQTVVECRVYFHTCVCHPRSDPVRSLRFE